MIPKKFLSAFSTTKEPKTKKAKKSGDDANALQNQIAAYLKRQGYMVIRLNSGSVRVRERPIQFYFIYNNKKSSGVSDLIAFKDNKCIFIEVKAGRDRMRDSQREFAVLCEATGNDYVIAESIADIAEYLLDGTKKPIPPAPKKRTPPMPDFIANAKEANSETDFFILADGTKVFVGHKKGGMTTAGQTLDFDAELTLNEHIERRLKQHEKKDI